MNKVLLVDDEVLVRNDLHTLINWEQYGFRICGESVNGVEALAMIEELSPDIVITDITMPGMNGVTLCKRIQSDYPGIKIIVLSSYDEFEFVRDTMKCGVVDYMLKHELTREELLHILQRIETQLAEEASQQKLWNEISLSVVQSTLRDAVLGRKEGLDHIESVIRKHTPHKPQHVVVAALQIDNFLILTASYSDADKNRFIVSAMELCQRMISERENGIACYIDQGRFVIVFLFEQHSQHYIYQQVADCLYKMKDSLEMYLGVHIFFEYSGVSQGLNQIHEHYESACHLLKERPYAISSNRRHNSQEQEMLMTLSLDHERKLMTAVKLLDERSSHRIIEEVLRVFKDRQGNHTALQLIVNELIHIANKIWVKSGAHQGKYYTGEYLTREQLRSEDRLDKTIEWLQQLYSELILRLLTVDGDQKYSSHVRMTLQYIHKNYAQAISLEQVASLCGLSPSYLSRSFKEEMNCGFTEYLNRVRIQAAQELIASCEYKIKDIYEKVGFGTYNYFFKVFKEMVGVTPHSYGKSSRD